MTDVATVWNSSTMAGDWILAAPALLADDGLRTAIAISLFTDRRADDGDTLPWPGDPDRRGWWGDLPLDSAAVDPIGSRLWLLSREKSTEATRRRAEMYIREALQWLITDRIAEAIDIATEWQGDLNGILAIAVTVLRGSGSRRFDFTWGATAPARGRF